MIIDENTLSFYYKTPFQLDGVSKLPIFHVCSPKLIKLHI